MTPGGRAQAAVELIDQIAAAAREDGAAADTLIARYFATRRYAGSKDRRAVREWVYAAIRLAGERPVDGRAAMVALADRDDALRAAFDGSPHAPAPIRIDEPRAFSGVAPAWLIDALRASGLAPETLPALVGRAPLDVRVNRLSADRDSMLAAISGAVSIPHAPDGLRLPPGTNLKTMPGVEPGTLEVQDAGSQIVTTALAARPGERIVDLCAGGGGKTLALAAAMANTGELLACDIDRTRLQRLPPRAARAGVTIVQTRLLDPKHEAESLADWGKAADGVLIDAPCSGTGTWRRNPEARWRLTPERVARLAARQQYILDVGAALVRPGGALVYIVCSLLDAEGAKQVPTFLDRHPGWRAEPLALAAGRPHGAGLRLDPARNDTDGFFVARLRAPC